VSVPGAYGGLDLLNAELGVLAQSWTGVNGTEVPSSELWLTNDGRQQPGTVRFDSSTGSFVPFRSNPPARRYEDGRAITIPGARSPFAEARDLDPALWNAAQDGCVRASDPGCAGASSLVHPFTGDPFQSELAAFSWNFQMLLVALSGLGKPTAACAPGDDPTTCRTLSEFATALPFAEDRCSYATPQLCNNVQALYAVAHTRRKTVRAGGNGAFGRLAFDWHVAGSGVLRYERRNVFGVAMDFAEDRTKSNWGFEATWIEGQPYEDNDELDGLRDVDTFNLTVSVDRPTFINFLNANRTFFINTQWFFQYVDGYRDSFPSNGPFNVLATLRVETGYFRDRLSPGFTVVYDFNSASGAMIPEIGYRFTENFSANLSVAWFWGRFQSVTPPINQVSDPPFRGGRHAQVDWVEEGLSPVRDRDEVSMILRYTW
jgi:hypothetical protein